MTAVANELETLATCIAEVNKRAAEAANRVGDVFDETHALLTDSIATLNQHCEEMWAGQVRSAVRGKWQEEVLLKITHVPVALRMIDTMYRNTGTWWVDVDDMPNYWTVKRDFYYEATGRLLARVENDRAPELQVAYALRGHLQAIGEKWQVDVDEPNVGNFRKMLREVRALEKRFAKHDVRGTAAKVMGRWAEYAKGKSGAFKAGLAEPPRAPDYSDVVRNMGYMVSEYHFDVAQAEERIRRMIARHPAQARAVLEAYKCGWNGGLNDEAVEEVDVILNAMQAGDQVKNWLGKKGGSLQVLLAPFVMREIQRGLAQATGAEMKT